MNEDRNEETREDGYQAALVPRVFSLAAEVDANAWMATTPALRVTVQRIATDLRWAVGRDERTWATQEDARAARDRIRARLRDLAGSYQDYRPKHRTPVDRGEVERDKATAYRLAAMDIQDLLASEAD